MDKTVAQGIIIAFVCIWFVLPARAGEFDRGILEYLFESEDGMETYDYRFDDLEYFLNNPINLKNASVNQIARLPGFGLADASEVHTLARSANNLNAIISGAGLSEFQAGLLANCAYIGDPGGYADGGIDVRMRWQDRMNKLRGFDEGKYLGSPLDFYQRFIYTGSKLEAGLLLNKNYGEKSLAEFASGYASAEFGRTRIIAGDYYIESGMGSILWGAFTGRKGAEVYYPALEYGSGIKPFRSTMDFSMFRGLAMEHTYGDSLRLTLRGWASSAGRSANIDEKRGVATSISRSSYYRTDTEIAKKNALHELITGGNAELASDNFAIGATAFWLDYEYPIESSSSSAFSGKSGMLSSVYGYWMTESSSLGGEIGRDARGNMCWRAGYQNKAEDHRLALSFRSYSPEFRSPYGSNFGEFSYPANEAGFYAGYEYRGIERFRQRIYIDIFRSWQRTYYVPEPVRGVDIFTETEFHPIEKSRLSVRLRWENKSDYWRNLADEKIIYQKDKSSARIEWQQRIGVFLRYRLRAEGKLVFADGNEPDESGLIAFAEAEWRIGDVIELETRMTGFATDSYESAIYQFEYAMQGCMYTVPLYGKGMRALIGAKLNLWEYASISDRFTLTHKPGEMSLGSGYDRIEGPTDRRIIIQIDGSF
ncbi:MAG: hypothetical protein ACLFQX_02330 [Candidatus Kapaibacterium sp.]